MTLGKWLSVDPRRNRFRVYRMDLGPDLWGETCLVKAWGRIGKRPQRCFHWSEDSQELARLLQETIRKRNAHNYHIG